VELQQLYHRIREAAIAFGIILIIGSVGYKYLGTDNTTMFDGLYMTILTVSTIGFEEVIELDNNFLGRVFTIFIAFSGIGILTFILSNFAALFIEGGLREKLRIKKMEKIIDKWTGHYILCGLGQVGFQTAKELETTRHKYVFADSSTDRINNVQSDLISGVGFVGDCTDDEFLLKLGVERAEGLFITTGDDNVGLMICLSARQLNPKLRIIARCTDQRNMKKFTSVGANTMISPAFIGGMRIASEMVRPTVTTFLDKMLRGDNPTLRIEEIGFSENYVGKNLLEIPIQNYKNTLVLAVREGNDWIYNPPRHHQIKDDTVLIVMTSPEDRIKLVEKFTLLT